MKDGVGGKGLGHELPPGVAHLGLPHGRLGPPVGDAGLAGGSGLEPLAGPYQPGFGYDGFFVSPTYGPAWTGLSPWAGPFAADPLYYDTFHARWPVELPTASMVATALPEGVIEPGGSVSGFLFFEDVPEEVERVTFRMDLVNADTGESFGGLRIPFIPKDA